MTFLSIICALVLEQIKALPASRVAALQSQFAELLERHFNGGENRHGMTAWGVGVALPAVLLLALRVGLEFTYPIFGFAIDVAILYLTMGFRQFSHFFTDIQLALRMGEIDRARRLMGEWRGQSAEQFGSAEIARLTIEQGILSSHRHVFAPLFWFMMLGPAGAVLYRLALGMAQDWTSAGGPLVENERFGEFARRAFQALDWLPARLTAVTFAIVGDFEDAVYCWRTQAAQWPDAASGILLASGAGALGIRLGQPLPSEIDIEARPELGLGDDADVEHLQSAIGLVWRALVLCLLLLALLTVASWVGS
jgi:adenosylcobinamide-phosphate synthase